MIDPPDVTLPQDCEIVLAKPGDYAAEKHFLEGRRIGLIVCRNSGAPFPMQNRSCPHAWASGHDDFRPPVVAKNIVASPEDAIIFARAALGFERATWLCAS